MNEIIFFSLTTKAVEDALLQEIIYFNMQLNGLRGNAQTLDAPSWLAPVFTVLSNRIVKCCSLPCVNQLDAPSESEIFVEFSLVPDMYRLQRVHTIITFFLRV